ncbi:MAG: phage baseplate protein [Candidatus Ventricola sp.]
MADIAQEMRYKIDVGNGLVKQPMAGVLMRGDKNANRIIAQLVDGDKDVSLDGVTVTGKFFRGGDGIEIPLEGEASGNEATVLLDEHCYAVDGYFEASIKLTTGGATRTILTITGNVESDGEGGILDIENVVPSVADIVAQYQRMQEITAQTEAARDEALEASRQAGFRVLDRYTTYELMTAAHPTGEAGEAYAVGTEEDNVVYIWGVDVLAWVNIGPIIGPVGPKGETGQTGDTGVGIASIERTAGDGSAGSVDTYTITYTDGTSVTYQVRNGADGKDADLSDDAPNPLGTASSGTSGLAARADHVHKMPSASDVGALASGGTAADSSKLGGKSLSDVMLAIYPVGAIYISTVSTSPATLFGGTWERIQDRFLLGAGSTYSAGSTGGEATHTLTIDETPKHYHEFPYLYQDLGTGWSSSGTNQIMDSTGATSEVGGGKAHNNMPPYLAVYMWKRVS